MGRVILAFFLAVILALGLSIFSAWNWVDGQLNKQSWLTNKADTAGESWLILGSDEREGTIGDAGDVTGFRTDTILVLTKPKSGPSSLISIPRDSYVPIEGHGNDKINHAYAYGGIELLQQTVESLLNIPIDYYALIDFAGFEDVVDALGGVEIEVDKWMYYQPYDGLIDIEAGVQRLDGEKALQYVRFRADSLGDITRVSRQQTLMKAIVHEFVENNGYWKLPQLLPAINRAVETNLSTLDMVRLAFLAKDLDLDALESATLEGDFMLLNEISYWQVDEAALQALVATHFGGGH